MQAARGFSLVEMLVAVAVAGILMAAALPAYSDYVLRSRRSDAANALAQVQMAQERWRGNNTSYAPSLAALGLPATSPQGHYTVAVTASSASGYAATATASSSQQAADSACRLIGLAMAGGNISYTSSNADGVADSAGSNRCWAR